MGSQRRVDPSDVVILDALRGGGGGFVSGAALAEELGISRAAVGKRVGLLRDQGWEIEAVPRLGYRLVDEPDNLHPLVIEAGLSTRWLGRDYRYRESVGSTNEALARLAMTEALSAGTVLVANEQTAGRGRLGRSWVSPRGENLYVSLLLRPPWAPSQIPPVTLAVAVAVARALETFLGDAPVVKWPNDLLGTGGRKLCGILAEMSAELDRLHHIIIGVGVNVNQTRFGRGITATSLAREIRQPVSRAKVLVRVLAALEEWLDLLLEGGDEGRDRLLDEWLLLAEPWLGQPVVVRGANDELTGVAAGIDTSGALLVEADGETHRVLAGDVTLA
ncbi:MAG: biotin--[acetyl-CoA-carboxylase] ligase [Proteobacteria bacterium]|nr:MAG: biotin--[acetyl-CoA-carboxylase] ligase [Pseudomonadota bacterium]PIE19395.1 MAG: biotin--[acetyl-CoA-carboxylase] ligase [Pseudomonadota bacterium]